MCFCVILHTLWSNYVGGTNIVISGSSFGTLSSVGDVLTIGGNPCSIVFGQRSSTQLSCTLPAGRGLINALVFSVSGQYATQSFNFFYDPPAISSVSPSRAVTQGGTLLTLTGTSFDTSGVVTVGNKTCSIITYSHTSITCTMPAGQGVVPLIVATIGGQNTSTFFTYSSPAISSVSPTLISTSGRVVTITGSNFGTIVPVVTVGG
jgi:hypothetical protein